MSYNALSKSTVFLSVPYQQVSGGMNYCKVVPSCKNFATTLKHNIHEVSVKTLIVSLDVEEKAQAAEDTSGKGDGQSSANMV
jgi:hypothetical protein